MWEPLHTLVTMSSSAHTPYDEPPRGLERDIGRWLSSMGITATLGADSQHSRCFSVELVCGDGTIVSRYDCWLDREATNEELACLYEFLREWVDDPIVIFFGPRHKKRPRSASSDTIDLDPAQEEEDDFSDTHVPEAEKNKQKFFFFGSYRYTGTAEEHKDRITSVMDPLFDSWRAQVEVGEEKGFPHVQFTGRVKKRTTINKLVTHLEDQGAARPIWVRWCEKERLLAPRGTGAYCAKEDTRMAGTTTVEVNFDAKNLGKQQGKRSDLLLVAAKIQEFPPAGVMSKEDKLRTLDKEFGPQMIRYGANISAMVERQHVSRNTLPIPIPYDWQRDMLERLRSPPEDRKIFWVWGHVGCRGKSTLVRLAQAEGLSCTALGGKLADISYLYDHESIVFFDVPRAAKHADIEDWFKAAESLKGGWIVSTKWATKRKQFDPPHIVFLANIPPPEGNSIWTSDRVIEILVD